MRKEARAAKKLDREQAEAESRVRRCGRRVGVGAGAGREPMDTGGRSATSMRWEGATAALHGGSATVDRGACRRPSTGAPRPMTPTSMRCSD